ncbi:MAG: hypothetical protein ACI8ZM_002939 [Crocinitomix sp.]|jgi:hypothetical protein
MGLIPKFGIMLKGAQFINVLALIVSLFLSINSIAQKPYAWINMQYNANYNGEFDQFFEYRKMEGPVRQIETFEYIIEQDSFSLESMAKYNSLGQFIYYAFYSSKESEYPYYIDEKGTKVYRGRIMEYDTNYYAFEYNTAEDSVKTTSKWYSETVYADSLFYSVKESYLEQDKGFDLKYDSTGRVIEYWFDSVPVYTTYDKFGRKVCDSVIGTGHGVEHVHEYCYSKNTVIKKETNPWDVHETKYEVDAHGNWINMYYRKASPNWVLFAKRNIKYYE